MTGHTGEAGGNDACDNSAGESHLSGPMKSGDPNTEVDGSVLGDDATLRSCPDWPALAGSRASVDSLTALAGADPAELSGPELVEAVVASEKAMSMLAAMQMRLLSAFAKPFVAGDPMRLAARLARKNCITGDEDPNKWRCSCPRLPHHSLRPKLLQRCGSHR